MPTRLYLLIVSILGTLSLAGEEPVGLADRSVRYFETAVAVISRESEILEKDGRKFRILLQDVESEKITPKLRSRGATGFFLFDGGAYYFVTAQHVARVIHPRTRISFLNSVGQSRQFVVGKLAGEEEKLVWRHHDEADVSVLELALPENGVKEVADLALRRDDLHVDTPPRLSKLIISGYPGGLGTRGGKISPITAVVHLASEEVHLGADLEGVAVKSAYLVNPPAGKGFSGAPIFYVPEEGTVKCIGILNGAWSDPTGGKFSFSSPARYIVDLLEKE